MTHKVKLINYLISNLGDLGQKVVISELLFFQIKDSKGVLPSAAHILKWEQYREDDMYIHEAFHIFKNSH